MITLSSKDPSPAEVSKALKALQTAGYTWVDEDQGELREHLARHAPDASTVGSKYSKKAWIDIFALHKQARDRCIVEMAQAHLDGRPLRVENSIDYPNAGVDGVIKVDDLSTMSTLGRTKIVRDPGTRYEQSLEVEVVADGQDFPATHQVIAVAGPYGDTGQIGMYTMFPGASSSPFPSDDMELKNPELNKASKEYWDSHVFLATTDQALLALRNKLENLQATPTSTDDDLLYHEDELHRLTNLQRKPEVNQSTVPTMK